MATTQPIATPTSPQLIKRIEKEIVREAKDEEKSLKAVIKDLANTEKKEHRAQKDSVKAERMLEKMEKREQSLLKGMYKAEHDHEVALADLSQAEKDVTFAEQQHGKMKETLQDKTVRVEQARQANDEHTRERNDKLDALRTNNNSNTSSSTSTASSPSPAPVEEAAKVVP